MGRKARSIATADGLVLVALLICFSGCGGGDSKSGAARTPAEVEACIVEGGGQKWPLSPTMPAGSPSKVQAVYAIGPNRGHIGVLFSLSPEASKHMAKGFDALGEYRAIRVMNGRMLILVDGGTSKRDKELTFECIEG